MAAVVEPEIRRHAGQDDQVRLLERPAPLVPPVQRMPGPEKAAGHAGEIHGHVQTADGVGNGVRLAGGDQCLAADDEEWPLRSRQPRRRPSDGTRLGRRRHDRRNVVFVETIRLRKQPPCVELQVGSRRTIRQRVALRRRSVVPLANHGFVVQEVDRALDEDRARHAALRDLETLLQRGRKVPHPFHRPAPLDVRPEERELVDVLQGAAPLQQRRGGAAQQHHRRLRELRVLDRRDRVGHAGPGGYRRDPRNAGQPGRRIRGEHGRNLVARVHDLDSSVLGAFQDG